MSSQSNRGGEPPLTDGDGAVANPSHEADLSRRIQELEARLADLEARLPAHSVPPAMWEELEELEEELARLRHAARSAEGKRGGTQS